MIRRVDNVLYHTFVPFEPNAHVNAMIEDCTTKESYFNWLKCSIQQSCALENE